MKVDRETGVIELSNSVRMHFEEGVRMTLEGKTEATVEMWPSYTTRARAGWEYSADDLIEYANALLELSIMVREMEK